jgi:virginiamycin B lyase
MATNHVPHSTCSRSWFFLVLLVTLVSLLAGCGAAASQPAGRTSTPTWEFTGMIREFPVSASDTLTGGLTTGPDGALWFTEVGKIGRITTTGTLRAFPLPDPQQAALTITTGPDGALWFLAGRNNEPQGGAVGRITLTGLVSEFPLPAVPFSPDASFRPTITSGPDGALWFTEVGKIGRITTAGSLQEFPLPNGTSSATGLTTGPDGALWFAQVGTIGRITTAGTILQEFPLPAGDFAASALTSGPDGALWFTEVRFAGQGPRSKIGRITMAGTIREFPLPQHYLLQMTVGPDGALWFTEFAPMLGRISTAGTIKEFPLATHNFIPSGITVGPDGQLWISAEDFNGRGGELARLG